MHTLLQKYDVPGPRYTSYPTVPAWTGLPDTETWIKAFRRRARETDYEASLYLHIPYCRSLCTFCGCTKVITRDKTLAAPLIHALLAEFRLYRNALGRDLSITDIHLGGGSPTWLDPEEFTSLMRGLQDCGARPASGQEISIEIDPRTVTDAHLDAYRAAGVNRVSLGVQDFNPQVLHAIRREQSLAMVTELVQKLRDRGIHRINFDLVFGLPHQTPETVAATVAEVIKLQPSRIAFYGYAHVPWIKPAQKLLETQGLPTGIEKRALYEMGRSVLLKFGYREIGMDHFALPCDDLYLAAQSGQLHRNFMGYTAHQAPLLIGLGPSSLSDCGYAFAQNEKVPQMYLERVERGEWPLSHGHVLSEREIERRGLILNTICRMHTQLPQAVLSESERNQLEALEQDGLVRYDGAELRVTEQGRPFLRNICMVFDDHLKANPGERMRRFSRTV
ncbi:MAG: oxygen-independent coproporphyrinogen III oxidase [Bdellovibrionales bacterium]|nr:oxygen-independent coproporphyrinogen III oxidase [Bdellovibrionales bacterium]